MSAINLAAQRALTEKRGKELDRWIMMKCVRLMSGIEPFSPTLSDLPTEIIHHVVEKLEPVEVITSREMCRSMRNVINKFVLPFGGILLFLKNNKVSEQVSATFSGMPTKIINQVVEKMQPIDRLRTSKVCRGLRTAVDKFGLRFGYISLNLCKDNIEMWFSGTETIYNTAANGNSIVNRNGQKRIIDGENFVERALKDFKIVSKQAGKIIIRNETKDRRDIFTTFIEFLKSEKNILVKELELWKLSLDEILTTLSSFDPEVLKNIKLGSVASIDQFEQITHLEQWENAEEFKIFKQDFYSTMIVHLFHFKCFYINNLDKFSAQTAIQMRDDLLRRSTFQSCEIFFEKPKSNPIEIARVFKPDYAGGNEFKIEYSNGNDKFVILLEEGLRWTNDYHLKVERFLK